MTDAYLVRGVPGGIKALTENHFAKFGLVGVAGMRSSRRPRPDGTV